MTSTWSITCHLFKLELVSYTTRELVHIGIVEEVAQWKITEMNGQTLRAVYQKHKCSSIEGQLALSRNLLLVILLSDFHHGNAKLYRYVFTSDAEHHVVKFPSTYKIGVGYISYGRFLLFKNNYDLNIESFEVLIKYCNHYYVWSKYLSKTCQPRKGRVIMILMPCG